MELHINRTDFHDTELVDVAPAPLDPGQARLRIDAFALTSNNITYVAIGELMQYWDFFPAPGPWGIVPVWGFAEVVESRHDDVAVGTRLYGFLPTAEELVITVGKVDDHGLTDGAAHRQPMAAVYNRYNLADPSIAPGSVGEDRQMVLYPLFVTSFLVDDYLGDNDYFGAGRVVISSASSKTALGVAHQAARRDGVEVVGLTSAANVDFVTGLGVYDRVASYDDLDALPSGASVYVDVTGSATVRRGIHAHYGDDLRHDMILGGTHWEDMAGGSGDLAGPTPAFFFAPGHVAKRNTDWGPAELDRRIEQAWGRYSEWAGGWIDFHHDTGPVAVERIYRELLDNRSDPTVGHIVSMTAR